MIGSVSRPISLAREQESGRSFNFHDPELGHFNFPVVLELQTGQREKSGFGEPFAMSRNHTWPHLVLLTALSEMNSSSCQPTLRPHLLPQPQPPGLICPLLCSTQPRMLPRQLFLLPVTPHFPPLKQDCPRNCSFSPHSTRTGPGAHVSHMLP